MIPATAHTDDHLFQASFDAEPYFAQASEQELAALVDCGFGGDYPADRVAEWTRENVPHPELASLFDYLARSPRMGRDPVGFECHVDVEAAEAWLRRHHPSLAF